ncbi:SDR family oxidoreductase [Labedaea rhizosphaerae]|uniref:Uncharacterized protein YbjT (DUF2867 family) n=1 Tax=Labedaea rhizosphaerae TaxID=598644 RepID=A0A4R6RR52_LABRH|nr:NAD(P)H-binding protein [Labedaea rhizosphaerae]TDP89212.1 uncharacterized protein YbjT (DUF2867 family) [Labedaea rhizosphaerae]
MTTLVTGASGELGRVLVGQLGPAVRKMSRTARDGDGWVVADLKTGAGLAAAVDGVDTIVHCASSPSDDAEAVRNLIEAAPDVRHLIYISIVGIDEVPLPYYKAKLAAEKVIESSGVPHTILRATQFHTLLVRIFTAAAKLPVMPVPAIPDQPIAVSEVAVELAKLAGGEPAGRVPDLGGPETRPLPEFAKAFLAARGKRRPILPVRVPGRTFAAFRRGEHVGPSRGSITFEEYLRNPDTA